MITHIKKRQIKDKTKNNDSSPEKKNKQSGDELSEHDRKNNIRDIAHVIFLKNDIV